MSSETNSRDEQFPNSNAMLSLSTEIDQIFTEKLRKIGISNEKNKQVLAETTLREWIATLQNTNQDLISTYNELETEACNRLSLLTSKMNETKQKFPTSMLNEDLRTLLEVIRRLREEQSWSADGLEFHTITCEDVYGPSPNNENAPLLQHGEILSLIPETQADGSQVANLKEELDKKTGEIENLRKELDNLMAVELEKRQNQAALTEEEKNVFQKLNQVVHENADLKAQLGDYKQQLEEKEKKVREIKDDKIALINEVADKHSEFLKQRTVNNDLETSLRYLKMKLDTKNETIEQLNKDLKNSEMSTTTTTTSSTSTTSGNVCSSSCSCSTSNDTESTDSKFVFPIPLQPSADFSGEKVCAVHNIGDNLDVTTNTASQSSTTSSSSFSPTTSSSSTLTTFYSISSIDLKETDAVNVLKQELDELVLQIQEKDSKMIKQRENTDSLEQKLNESAGQIKNLQKCLANQKIKFKFIEIELIKLKKLYEKPLDRANPIVSFSNTCLNNQFERSLAAISDQEFHNETKMIEPLRNTLENLKNQLIALDARNTELEGSAKCWQDQAKKFEEKNGVLAFELSAASLQDSENCEMCQEMLQSWQKSVASQNKMKNEIIVGIQELLNKKLSIESLNYDPASTSSDGQVSPVQNLMKDLKQEIEAKDLLLKDKVDQISELQDKISVRDQEIKELSQRNDDCDQELKTSQNMISHLRQAVEAHTESVHYLKQEKEKLESELQSLQAKLHTIDESTGKLAEEKKQLENECKNQLTTICNLREALVAAKRGVAPSFVVSSTSSSNSENSLWDSLWRNVHDV